MAGNRSFGTVRKLSSGRYQARYTRHGKQLSSGQTFSTKADARAFLAAIETDIARGAFVEPHRVQILFGDYASQWLDDRDLRPRTRETYDSQLKWVNATFEEAWLDEITPADVRAWHGRLVRSALHANSVSKIYRMLRTILNTAVEDGWIKSNPAHIKGASRESMVERPLLTWEQVAALANAIPARFSCFVWLAATTGLRFGELAALTLNDVDLKSGTVTVRRSLAFERGVGPKLGEPKTASARRTVSVPAPIVARVVDHMADHCAGFAPSELLFTSVRGKPLLNRYFAPCWRRARAKVGLNEVRFHDLRHLAGTEAAAAGGSLREVMARMGHATSDASLRYLKASERRDREIAKALELRIAASQESDDGDDSGTELAPAV